MDLLIFQTLWGMEQLPGEKAEWSIADKLAAIRDAGFDGVSVELDEAREAKEIVKLVTDHGMCWNAACYPRTVDDFEWVADTVAEIGTEKCQHINIQADVRPITVPDCNRWDEALELKRLVRECWDRAAPEG